MLYVNQWPSLSPTVIILTVSRQAQLENDRNSRRVLHVEISRRMQQSLTRDERASTSCQNFMGSFFRSTSEYCTCRDVLLKKTHVPPGPSCAFALSWLQSPHKSQMVTVRRPLTQDVYKVYVLFPVSCFVQLSNGELERTGLTFGD